MERLIVDGYNIIFAWPELSALKDVNLQDARELLIATLADYADAEASEQTVSDVQVVYSGRKTSADHVIERLLFEARASDEVTVATSDALQRDLALGRKIKTVSALTLKAQVDAVLARRNQQIGDTRARSDIARRLEDRRPRWMQCWRGGTSRLGTPVPVRTLPAGSRIASTRKLANSSTGCGAANRPRNEKEGRMALFSAGWPLAAC